MQATVNRYIHTGRVTYSLPQRWQFEVCSVWQVYTILVMEGHMYVMCFKSLWKDSMTIIVSITLKHYNRTIICSCVIHWAD